MTDPEVEGPTKVPTLTILAFATEWGPTKRRGVGVADFMLVISAGVSLACAHPKTTDKTAATSASKSTKDLNAQLRETLRGKGPN